MDSIADIFKKLSMSDKETKILFYDRLSFNLTIGIRSICSNPETTDKEKLEGTKIINELSHRICHWTWRIKRDDPTFHDLKCLSDIRTYAGLDKHVTGEIGEAVRSSYRHLAER